MLTPPKNEIIWVQYCKKGEPMFAITSTPLRDMYHLYEVKAGKLVNTKHKAVHPLDLEKFIYTKEKKC